MTTLTTLSIGCNTPSQNLTQEHVTASLKRLYNMTHLDVMKLPVTNETLVEMSEQVFCLTRLSLVQTPVDAGVIQCLLPWSNTLTQFTVSIGTGSNRAWESGLAHAYYRQLKKLELIVFMFEIKPSGPVVPPNVRPRNLKHVRVCYPDHAHPGRMCTE
jgi:hypothetical protein